MGDNTVFIVFKTIMESSIHMPHIFSSICFNRRKAHLFTDAVSFPCQFQPLQQTIERLLKA